MYWAELNGESMCIAVTQPFEAPVAGNFVALDSFDTSVLWKTWAGSEWTGGLDEAISVSMSQVRAVLAQALGLTEEQIDDLLEMAGTL